MRSGGLLQLEAAEATLQASGDLAATVSLAVAQARRLPVRPVSRLGSVRVSSATPRRPPGLVTWVKVGLGCKLGSWRACLAAACTGTAWGRAFGSCHAMSFDRSYANLGIVGKPLTSSTTLQAGAEAHDATAGRHEPRKQTKRATKRARGTRLLHTLPSPRSASLPLRSP